MNKYEEQFTAGKIAMIFSVGRATVQRWIATGKLEAYCLPSGHNRVTRGNLEKFIGDQGNSSVYFNERLATYYELREVDLEHSFRIVEDALGSNGTAILELHVIRDSVIH